MSLRRPWAGLGGRAEAPPLWSRLLGVGAPLETLLLLGTSPGLGTHRHTPRARVGFTSHPVPEGVPRGSGVAGRHPGSGRGRPHGDPSPGVQSSNPGPGPGPALPPEPLSEPSVTRPHPQPPCLIPQEAGASVSSSCHRSQPHGAGQEAWGATVGLGASGSSQPSPNPELQNKAESPCLHSPGDEALTALPRRPVPARLQGRLTAGRPPSPTHLYEATRRRSEGARR